MASLAILIVEDDRPVATLLSRVLQAGGYEVFSAQSGTEAIGLSRLHQREIALLLCDIMLQDRAGPDVALRVGELCPEMRTLFTSGYPLDVLIERGLLTREILANEKTSYIQKPFLPKELLRAVNNLLPMQAEAANSRLRQAGAAHVNAAC
jgi:DNA-binding response OmpR family regulator